MWVAALALYLRDRRRTGLSGPVLLWSLVVISTVMWASSPWSPPPPSTAALGWFALTGWFMIPWAWGADRGYALKAAT